MLTFTERLDTLTVHTNTLLIDISDEEVSELSRDGAANVLCSDPAGDAVGFDVTELFQRQVL